jgi:hypothetical protein
MAMRGFWNDPDGITIEDLAVLASLGLYVFVGVKIALAGDVSTNQVDFFAVLGYPIIAAIAKKAIERIGWPTLGRRGQALPQQPPAYYNGYGGYAYYQPPMTPTQLTDVAPEPMDISQEVNESDQKSVP